MSSKAGYHHFLFDFDGVLCDSLALALAVFNEIREERFPQLPCAGCQDDMVRVYGGPLRDALREWLSPDESREFFDLHSAGMRAQACNLRPFPGVGRMLSDLGRRNVSIVTSAYSSAVRQILASDPEFDAKCLFRIGGRELGQTKTDKIEDILRARGFAKEDALYVGDLESDILYCSKVPIDIAAVGYGYHPAWYIKSKGAQYFAPDFAALRDLLYSLRPTTTNQTGK